MARLLERYSLANYPAGIGGCRSKGNSYECCEYDVSVFDGKDEPAAFVEFEGEMAAIRHCRLDEVRSNVLVQLDGMKIVCDEGWELRMALSRMEKKREQIYRDCMKNCLVESLFCVARSRQGLAGGDPFAACWAKCAAFYLADAVLLHRMVRPSPAHLLLDLRELGGSKVDEKFSVINECVGAERATPVLLERMLKSAAGFSDMVETNGHSKVMSAKAAHLMKNSSMADCYFYLGCITRNNLSRIRRDLKVRPELIHILKVALDAAGSGPDVGRQAGLIHDAAGEILSAV